MLTIGEFASLGHISPRMLRHYDALGLLRPDAVGENGYRYYSQEQLSGLVRIQRLSGYGFSLREIGPLLALDEEHLLACLQKRQLELRREAAARGLRQAGPIQMLYHDPAFSHERSDVEAQMVVAQEGPGVGVKPRQTCAAVRHHGPYENLHLAYEALCAWLAEHTEYRPCGPAMDRYLNDPHDTPPEALETGVLFPVEKV